MRGWKKWVAEQRRSKRKHGDPPLARPLSYNLRVYVDARHVHKRPMANPAVRQNDRINSRDSTKSVFPFPCFFLISFFFILRYVSREVYENRVEFLINPRGTKIEAGELGGKN